jgi:polysaccharide export outer membrane protein
MRAHGRRVMLLALFVLLALAGQAATGDYEIGPGDTVRIAVLGQADMTGNFSVDLEGMISFPVLGKIKAAEHTPGDLERKLTTLLADGYLKRPQVTVAISEFGSQKVYVTGEVQKPGQYSLKTDRTLLALLGDVGALGPNVGHEVIVVRPPAGAAAPPPAVSPLGPEFPAEANAAAPTDAGKTTTEPAANPAANAADGTPAPAAASIPGLPYVAPGSEVYRVSLLELQSGNPEKNIALRAGDTVYFPKASQVYVMGSVARPGPYRYQEGMTVLQALTQAGGATDRGSAGRTKVVRIVNGKKVERKANPTDIVQPDDTLFVPERFF